MMWKTRRGSYSFSVCFSTCGRPLPAACPSSHLSLWNQIKLNRCVDRVRFLWLLPLMLVASKKYIKLLVKIHTPQRITITPVVDNHLLEPTSRVIAQTIAITLRYRLKDENKSNSEDFAEAYLLSQGSQVQHANGWVCTSTRNLHCE